MATLPRSVADFLSGKRIAVAGVSRSGQQAANAIFRKLRDCGYEALPVNPATPEIEGVRCFPKVTSIPGAVDGVVIATHPKVAIEVVRESIDRGVTRVWFHRSFGQGSVSEEAVGECQARGIHCIVGGCPLMYCEPVDGAHRCFRWWLGLWRRVPR
jgi:predicted CoA-binding protein